MVFVPVLALACVLAAAPSPKGPPTWVVLVRGDEALPAMWPSVLQEAARQAASTSGRVRWVAPPAVPLEEAQLALGCASWGPKCAGQIAAAMSASAALMVEVSTTEAGPLLSLTVVSQNGTLVEPTLRRDLPNLDAPGLAFARAMVAGVVRGARPTILYVATDVPDADVFIDGTARGKTPLMLVDEIEPGTHALRVTKEGRAPASKQLVIELGQAQRVDLQLSANGVAPVKPTLERNPAGVGPVDPVFAWTTLGTGGVVTAASVAALGVATFVLVEQWSELCTAPCVMPLVPGQEAPHLRATRQTQTALASGVGGGIGLGVGLVILGAGAAMLLGENLEEP